MATEIRYFRRRNIVERKVLHIVRAGSLRSVSRPRPAVRRAAEHDFLWFWCLREFSVRCGLEIMPPDARYLSISELWLLRWLAEGQRHNGLRSVHITDPGFRASLLNAARILRDVGLFLPAKTLTITICRDDVAAQAGGFAGGRGLPAIGSGDRP